jgi:serine/threonine protein kinase
MTDFKIGDRVYGSPDQGVYEIVRHIGGGAFGTVFELRNEQGEPFALKTISTTGLNEIKFRALINEGNTAIQVRHPNVIRVLFFHDGKQYPIRPPYMITEYADGGTLEDLLNQLRTSNTFLSSDELRAIFLPLAEGMKAINEKLVHRDIKPDNILRLGGEWKIADFGLSKIVGEATRTQTFKGVNHPRYCAPEAWKNEENQQSMDMYSMGITFFEVATLRNPFNPVKPGIGWDSWKEAHFFQMPLDPMSINPHIDLALKQLILKMISKRPGDRYSTWDDVIQRLQTGHNGTAASSNTQPHNVQRLMEQAMQSKRLVDEAKLREQELDARRAEFDKLVMFHYGEIRKSAADIAEAFNQQSDDIKLRLHNVSKYIGPGFIIYSEGLSGNRQVEVALVGVFGQYKLKGQSIHAWGYAKAPSGRGFNLVLVPDEANDPYGKWLTLHVSHTGLGRKRDERPSSFPFEIHELPNEIGLVGAVHIYNTKVLEFEPGMLEPLIHELLA